MVAPSIHSQNVAVVLLGGFNPRIFEPLWFSTNGLIPASEAEAAEVQLVNNDFCHVHLPWVDLVVVDDKMQVQATEETVNDSQVRDLVVGILRLLPHTPINQGSIHHRIEIKLGSEAVWHEVGHRLAPKELWDGILDKPGMFDLAMSGVRPDDHSGAIKVRIRPSQEVHPGIFMNVNDEFVPSEDESGGSNMADLIYDLWPDAEERAVQIRSQLLPRLVD